MTEPGPPTGLRLANLAAIVVSAPGPVSVEAYSSMWHVVNEPAQAAGLSPGVVIQGYLAHAAAAAERGEARLRERTSSVVAV